MGLPLGGVCFPRLTLTFHLQVAVSWSGLLAKNGNMCPLLLPAPGPTNSVFKFIQQNKDKCALNGIPFIYRNDPLSKSLKQTNKKSLSFLLKVWATHEGCAKAVTLIVSQQSVNRCCIRSTVGEYIDLERKTEKSLFFSTLIQAASLQLSTRVGVTS